MKKFDDFERMNPIQRREFLQALSVLLAAPFVPSALKYACNEVLMGQAFAQEASQAKPTYFIEINFRDQFDFGASIVPPGIAKANDLKRGDKGDQVVLFTPQNELIETPNNAFLTKEGRDLRSHMDSVAVLELFELGVGSIHNHEAANATRSPGRSYKGGPGRSKMWLNDPRTKTGGNENHYSSTPTPAVIHNYVQKQINPNLRNGVIYKGISRDIHTVYHFAANLNNAELDRFQSTRSFVSAFKDLQRPVPQFLNTHANTITRLIDSIDSKFLSRLRFAAQASNNHQSQLADLGKTLDQQGSPAVENFSLALSEQERNYWRDNVSERNHRDVKAHIWEQMAYASKLITSGMVRTVALEFDHIDLHGDRSRTNIEAQGTQFAVPLARLIQSIKDAGIYDQTVIACYTTDGGRSPASNSWGTEGKNAVVLAGGKIKGGYYGDIRIAGNKGNGHRFSYHRPDETTGRPISNGTTGNDKRLSGGSIWKTVAKAVGVPASLYNSYPDVKNEPELNFVFKS